MGRKNLALGADEGDPLTAAADVDEHAIVRNDSDGIAAVGRLAHDQHPVCGAIGADSGQPRRESSDGQKALVRWVRN